MTITTDQVLGAYESSLQEGSHGTEESAIRSLVDTPPLDKMSKEQRESYFDMNLEQRSQVISDVINKEAGTAQQMTVVGQTIEEGSDPNEVDGYPQDQMNSDLDYDYAYPELRGNTMSQEAEDDQLTWAGAMRAVNKGEEVVQGMLETHFGEGLTSPQDAMSNESTEYRLNEASEYRKIADRTLGDTVIDPMDVADTIQAADELATEEENMSMDVFHTFVDMYGEGELAPEVAEEIAGSMAMWSAVRDATDKLTIGDQIWDVARTLSPHASISDNLEIAGSIDAASYISDLKEAIDNLAPEDREGAIRAIGEQLEGDLPAGRKVALMRILASPTGRAEADEEFSALWALVDTADVAAGVLKVAVGGYATFKGLKALRAVKGRRASKDIANTVAASVTSGDKTASAKLGLDNDSTVGTLDPFNSEWITPDAIDGVSADTQASIRGFEEVAKNTTRGIIRETSYLKEGWISDEEIQVIKDNTESILRKKEGVDNVVTRREGDTIIADYTWVDEEGIAVDRSDTIELKLNEDLQVIELKDPGIVKNLVADKGVWATDDFRKIVQQAERLDNVEAGVLGDLRDLWTEALAPVVGRGFKGFVTSFTPKQRKKVELLDKILIKGDEAGEFYSVDQLQSGELGFKVTDEDVIDSYYRVRTMMDNLYYVRNDRKRRELALKDYKNLMFENHQFQEMGKPMSDANAAQNSINTNNPRYIYDDTQGDTFLVNSFDIQELYNEGKSVVRLDSPTSFVGNEIEVRYAIIDSSNVGELPLEVIPYRPGYVTKINDRVGHVVKEATPRNADGVRVAANSESASMAAVRFFDSKKEADIWVENENRKLQEQGITPDIKRYVRHEDQQLEKEHTVSALSDTDSPFGGGLYTGARSTREILYGTEGVNPPRVNTFEAISRAISATSRYAVRNEWRLGLEKRIVETANQLRAGDHAATTRKFENFEDLSGVGRATENDRKINAMYNAARDWLNFPGTEELVFKQGVQRILDNSGILTKLPGSREGLHSLKSSDPVGAARSAAFQGLLGFLNPVQLWVQAQGAAVAMSMNIFDPKNLARSMRDQFTLQYLQYVKLSDGNVGQISKALKIKEEEVWELKNAFDRTGLADGVLVTADHAAAAAGYGIDNGAWRRGLQKGLFFYSAGELFNRRFSFATAYREWKAANNGAELTDEALRTVTTRANNLMLNMGKARRASWQKGILGLSTQFQQVNVRTLETLLGANGNFSMAERGKIMLGQAALYGAAGVPLASLGASYLMEMGGYKSQLDMEQELGAGTVKAMNEGFLGWITLQALGADIEIGDRSALLGGTRRLIGDLMFTDGTTGEKIFGAFSNTGSRFWMGLLGQYEPLSLSLAQNRALDPLKVVSTPILSAVSSFRNVDKAIFMHNMNRIADKNWNNIVSRDFNPMEEISTAIGFRLTEESTLYKLRARNEAQSSYEAKVRNLILTETNKMLLLANTGNFNQDLMEQYKTDVAVLMQSLGSEKAMLKVQKDIENRMLDTKSAIGKEWDKYVSNSATKFSNEAASMQRLFTDPAGTLKGTLMGGDFLREGNLDNEGDK